MINKTIEWVAIYAKANNERESILVKADTHEEATEITNAVIDGLDYKLQNIVRVGEIETVDHFANVEHDEELAALYYN